MNGIELAKITLTKSSKLSLRNIIEAIQSHLFLSFSKSSTFLGLNLIKIRMTNLYIAAYKPSDTSSDILNNQSLQENTI